jgi:ADP-ribose pyrophosphatase YjhB (NUDIX family)
VSTQRQWFPRITVAAVVEREGRYLLIEEESDGGAVFNQPAGHLDPGESLRDAVAREALEESAHTFEPTALVGVYHYREPRTNITYVRFAFAGNVTGHDSNRALDAGILRAVWVTPEEAKRSAPRHRSPLVMRCIEDHAAGKRYPLELLAYYSA